MTPCLKKLPICLLIVLWLTFLAVMRAMFNILSRR
jgi:hypothetical protein